MSAAQYCDEYTCPYINSEKCGDVDTLDVIQQFRKLYENKLREIDQQGCTDSVKLKLKVQQKWIEDLTEQTEMMARVVKELELEAAERVQLLEEKLKKSAECACERIACLENDIKNLLEFIRRIREDGKWSIDGLAFYDVDYQDLFGKDQQDCKCNSDVAPIDEGICRGEEVGKIMKLTIEITKPVRTKSKKKLLSCEPSSSGLANNYKNSSAFNDNKECDCRQTKPCPYLNSSKQKKKRSDYPALSSFYQELSKQISRISNLSLKDLEKKANRRTCVCKKGPNCPHKMKQRKSSKSESGGSSSDNPCRKKQVVFDRMKDYFDRNECACSTKISHVDLNEAFRHNTTL